MRVSFNFILFFFLWVTSDSSGLEKSKKKNKKKKEKTILVTIDNKIERRLLRYCEDAIKDSTKERTSLTVTSLLACIVIKEEEEKEEMVAARATLRMRFYSRYYVYCIIVQKDRNKERERDMYVLIYRTWCPWFNTFTARISKFSTFFFTIVNLDRSASIEQYSNKRGERVKSRKRKTQGYVF